MVVALGRGIVLGSGFFSATYVFPWRPVKREEVVREKGVGG